MSKTRKIVFAALMTSSASLCSQMSIPTPWGIPINLATLAVFLSGALLGPLWGGGAITACILLGMFGAPVFAGMNGGLPAVMGPTGGYIIGYAAAAFTVGAMTRRHFPDMLSMAFGLTVCYAFGTLWYMRLMGTGIWHSLMLCVLPYIPGDILKIAAASLLVQRLRPVICKSKT